MFPFWIHVSGYHYDFKNWEFSALQFLNALCSCVCRRYHGISGLGGWGLPPAVDEVADMSAELPSLELANDINL